jgi:DNA-binding transcriptional LysR family regulator
LYEYKTMTTLRPEHFSIEALTAFVAVVDCGSFSSAAEHLHLTQPAVTKRIQALEQTLGQPLFERLGRQIRPLEAAAIVLPQAREILARLADIERSLRDRDDRIQGVLRLATSHHIALHRLPPALNACRSRYPEIELELAFLDSEAGIDAVARRQVDLALATLPEKMPEGLESGTLWSDQLTPMLRTDLLAAAPDPASADWPAWLEAQPGILPPAGSATRLRIDRALHRIGLHLEARHESPYLEVIRMLTRAGLGLGVLPRSLGAPGLTCIELPGLDITRSLGWVRHRARHQSRAEHAFIGLLRDTAAEREG